MGGESAKKRDDAVLAFQAGTLRGIGITTAGAEGITLTRASNMIRVDRSFSVTENRQVEDRIHRFGQGSDVTIYDLWAEDAEIDAIVDAVNRQKAGAMDAIGLGG